MKYFVNETTRNFFYSIITKNLKFILNILGSVVLARLIEPIYFGEFVILLAIFSFFQASITNAIIPIFIKEKDLENSIFTYTICLIIISIFIFILLGLLESLLVSNYEIKNSRLLILLTYISITLNIFSSIPISLNQKKLRFREIFQAEIIISLLILILSLILAFSLKNTLALVLKLLIESFLILFANFLIAKKDSIKGFNWKFEKIIGLVKNFIPQVQFNLSTYALRNLDNLIIGKVFGAANLGYYSKGYQIMMLPIQLISHGVTPVIQPTFQKLETKSIHKTYDKLTGILFAISIPITILLYYFRIEAIELLLGDNWLDIEIFSRLLILTIPFQVYMSTVGSYQYSLGNFSFLRNLGGVSLLLFLITLYLGIRSNNLEQFCAFYLIFQIINFLLNRLLIDLKNKRKGGFLFKFKDGTFQVVLIYSSFVTITSLKFPFLLEMVLMISTLILSVSRVLRLIKE